LAETGWAALGCVERGQHFILQIDLDFVLHLPPAITEITIGKRVESDRKAGPPAADIWSIAMPPSSSIRDCISSRMCPQSWRNFVRSMLCRRQKQTKPLLQSLAFLRRRTGSQTIVRTPRRHLLPRGLNCRPQR
jgi:hypothetical protein